MRIILSIVYAPIILFTLHHYGIGMDDVLALKAFPLTMSIIVTFLIYLSYLRKDSMVLKFAKRFMKKEISQHEQDYIQNSTLFWVGISFVNVIVHFILFMGEDIVIWAFYSSIGWYGVFIIGGILQFLHRKFIFLKRLEDAI
jgi:uncharacterized membrane protein